LLQESVVQVQVVSAQVCTGSPSDRAVIYGGPFGARKSSGSASVLWWLQGYVVQGRPAETRGEFWPSATWVCQASDMRRGWRALRVAVAYLQRCVWPRK
jgi:hypothetical protein